MEVFTYILFPRGIEVFTSSTVDHLLRERGKSFDGSQVKEEVDSALRKYIISMKRNCGKDLHLSEPRSLQLQFLNTISLPVFTGTRIEGEGGTSMEVALVDSLTRQVVSNDLGSSAKVEIVVLEGDFDGDEKDNWTLEEFRNNTVRERAGKKPLLSGDVIVTLKDGTGLVGNVMFTDNSSWTRSRKFRLGAKLLENIGDIRVREARSEPFVVRDHRGELWRLEKIGKDGAFHKRLRKERINTVQDFLMSLFLDPTRLRNADARELVISAFADREKIVTFDDEPSPIIPTSSNLSITQSPNLPPDGSYHEDLSSQKISRWQQNASSPDYMQSVYSVGGLSSFDDCLQSIDSVGIRSDQPLSYPGQVSDGLISDIDTMNRGFFSNEHLQYFETTDCTTLQTSHLEVSADIQSAINAFIPCSAVPIDKGQKGWNILVSVLRWWFSIKRIVARKTHVRIIPKSKRGHVHAILRAGRINEFFFIKSLIPENREKKNRNQSQETIDKVENKSYIFMIYKKFASVFKSKENVTCNKCNEEDVETIQCSSKVIFFRDANSDFAHEQ
ncbi:hypothetical protein DH2020_019345 [Rehmannia glutinosa]|uniref:Uncharacterized protein n=1 Tax=Rehmannia glutinosa TaxID=99300 RepID=A0ABR0WLK1_REHGL